jgi:uncharacterized protein (TIGR02996 family)
MTDLHAFLEAICEEPDDDSHRLVYADWLEEHGDEARAEFIRVQCALAHLPWPCGGSGEGSPAEDPAAAQARAALQARERELRNRHERAWLGPLRGRVDGWEFHRGLLTVVLSGRWWKHPWHRLWRLLGRPVLDSLLDTPAAREAWSWVDCLALNDGNDTLLADLVRSAHLAGIARLYAWGSRIGPAGARALAASPHLARLTCLHLGNNLIGPVGARALATSPYLPRRMWLHIHGNPCLQTAADLHARFERVTWGH